MAELLRKRASAMYTRLVLNRRYSKEIKLATRLVGLNSTKLKENYKAELDRLRILNRNDPAKLELVKHFSAVVRKSRDARQAPNNFSEEIGLAAARYEVQRMIADAGGDGVILVDGRRGNDTLDIVAVIKGQLVVVEAKGGVSKHPTLGTRIVQDDAGDWHVVRQGSRLYLRTLISKDKGLRRRLIAKGYKYILDEFEKDTGNIPVDYHLVHARIKHGAVVPGSNPRRRKPDSIQYVEMRTFNVTGGDINTISPPYKPRLSKADIDRERARVKKLPVAWGIAVVGASAGLLAVLNALAAPNASAEVMASEAQLSTAVGDFSVASAAFTAIAGVVSGLSAKFASLMGEVSGAHREIVEAWRSDDVQKLVSVVQRISGLFAAAAIAIQLWAIGQQILNMVMRANPLGAIVGAIGLAIAGIVLVVENWDTIKAAVESLYQNVLVPLGQWFGEIWRDTIVPMFQSCVNGVAGFFSGIVDSLHGVWDGILEGVKGLFRKAADFAEEWIPFFGDDAARLIRSFTDPEKKADGGLLVGPGGPRDDVIPVMASQGEFIVNAAATARNLPLLEAVNSGAALRFADGGVVEVPAGELFSWGGTDQPAGAAGSGGEVADSAGKNPGGRGGGSSRSRSRRSGYAGIGSSAEASAGALADYVLDASTARVFLDRIVSGAAFDGLESIGAEAISNLKRDGGHVGPTVVEAAAVPGLPAERFLAAGGFAGGAGGSGGGFVDSSLSLLQLISQDAGVVSNLNGRQMVPTAAFPGAGRRRVRNTDRSLAINISAPSVDAQFLQDKGDAGQRALSYAGRWS
ncbi:hypothetical protein Ntsu_01410 [Nocardia sp. IFM 10818]